jgi:D-sedoheptulose 7-phosphate isomerase
MDAAAYLAAEFDEHEAVVARTRAVMGAPFAQLVDLAERCIRGGGKILFFGNGGSAGDAQHLATELAVRYVQNREPIAALALTTDTSALTAIGNDLGFEQLFARQIAALGRPGDLAIGISTSGKSPNVLAGLAAARARGLVTVAFGGKDGGDLPAHADLVLVVPSNTTARIQEMHITIGQALCGALEKRLGLA